jgi:NDP-sugar pyrophosphorylase family protein
LLKNNVKIYGKLMKGNWEDIGNFERYKKALNLAKK